MQSRRINLCFAILFQIVAILLFTGFFLDRIREEDECQEATDDEKRRNGSPHIILFLVSLHTLYQFFVLSYIMHRQCRATRRRRLQPPQLSSDEEDDAEYLAQYHQRRARSGRLNQGSNANDRRRQDESNEDNQSLDETLETYELPTFPRMLPQLERRGEEIGELQE